MDYLLAGSHVTAVDEDIYQIALLDIKAVSIQHLPFDQYFAIFGESDIKLLRSVYTCSLRPHLAPETARYWDLELPNISSFIYARGVSGFFSKLMFQFMLPFIGLGFIKEDLNTGVSAVMLRKKLRGYKFRLQPLAYFLDSVAYRVGLCLPYVLGRRATLGKDVTAYVWPVYLNDMSVCRNSKE